VEKTRDYPEAEKVVTPAGSELFSTTSIIHALE